MESSLSAWERWVKGEPLSPGEVAPEVLASWERCRSLGLDPHGTPRQVVLAAEELGRRRQVNEALLSVAHRALANLCPTLPGNCFRFGLSDAEGYLLDLMGPAGEAPQPPWGALPPGLGGNWSEGVVGTNAIGTTLAAQAPVFLRPADHYFAGMRVWSCAGVPIRDVGGRVLGILSLSGPAAEVLPLAHGLIKAVAGAVERELEFSAATRRLEQQSRRLAVLNELEQGVSDFEDQRVVAAKVIESLRRLDGERSLALLSLSGDGRQLNLLAAYPTDPAPLPVAYPLSGGPLARCIRSRHQVLLTGDQVPDGLRLGGSRPESLLAEPVFSGSRLIGILLVLDPRPGGLDPADVNLYAAVARRLGAYARMVSLHRDLWAARSVREAILEQTDAGLVLIDLNRSRISWNRPMTRFFPPRRRAIRFEEALPRPDRAMRYPIRFADGDLAEILDRVVNDGETISREAVILCNPPQTFRVTTGAVKNLEGQVTAIVQTYTDVTSYRRLEQQKAELVAMISHELRTPLTGIKGYTQLLLAQDAEGDETRRRLADGLLRETNALTMLVERVVAVNKLELNAVRAFAPVSLGPLLQKVVAGLTDEARRSGVTIQFRGPDLTVRGDAEALKIAFANLAENAVKYSPPGALVTLETSREEGVLRVDVRDEGPGISPEYHEAIFQRFFRVPLPEAVSLPGSGLGLYLVRQVIERHGGRVSVTSKVGQGTTFTVILPEGAEEREEA